MAQPLDNIIDIHPDPIPNIPLEQLIRQDNVFVYPTVFGSTILGGQALFGSGNSCLKFDGKSGLWLGNAVFGSAPFRVTMAGSITATSGTIGGFTISASDITATNLSLVSGAANTARITVGTGANLAGMNSGNAAGDIALWAGATFANRATAPFRVEMDGDLTASSVNITGGTIGAAPTINGTRADVLQPRAETIFKRQIFLGAKNDGLTESVFFGTGTITRNLILTKLDTGSAGVALSGDIWTSSDSSEINWDSNYEVVTSVRLGTTGTLHNVFIGINSSTASHSPTTGRHFGFIIDNDSIVASNADGTTQTITSVSATVTSRNKYRIVKNGTTNIQFYINDTLVATHTTNLPTGTITPCLFLVIGQDYTPSGREIFIANGYSVIVDL